MSNELKPPPKLDVPTQYSPQDQETLNRIELRNRVSSNLIWTYRISLGLILLSALTESVGWTKLGENWKWLVGFLAAQGSLMTWMVRGLFSHPKE